MPKQRRLKPRKRGTVPEAIPAPEQAPVNPDVLAKLLADLQQHVAALQGVLESNAAYVAGAKNALPQKR